MKRNIIVFLMAGMMLTTSFASIAVNAGRGDTRQDRSRLQDQSCIVAGNYGYGSGIQDMLKIQEKLYLHDGSCQDL